MIEIEETKETTEELHIEDPVTPEVTETVQEEPAEGTPSEPTPDPPKPQWQIMLETQGEVSSNAAPEESEVDVSQIQVKEPYFDEWVPAEEKPKKSKKKEPKKPKEKTNVTHIERYRSEITEYKIQKWRRIIIAAAVVLAVVLISTLTVRNWKYHSFHVVSTNTEEDTVSFSYCSVGGNVLKYGIDIATLTDRSGKLIWSSTYTMTSPTVDTCKDTVAIYDKNGTGICICDSDGQMGTVTANLPILKAKVASQGTVAAIVDDGSNAMVQYYASNGSLISTIKTTIDKPGYPMDLALSEDGNLLAVSYLYFENGLPKTRLNFYNFGSAGQNQMDNNVSGFEYSDVIVPVIEYLSGNTCVAIRENGLTFFGGAQIPQETASIQVAKKIISTFHDNNYVGIVTESDAEDKTFTVTVYDKSGKKVFEEDTDFSYLNIEIKNKQVVLSNRNAFCVYALNGVKKFEGDLNARAQAFFSVGKNRFVYVTEGDFNQIKLG